MTEETKQKAVSDLKETNKCTISFVGNSTPQEKFEQLKKAIIEATDEIDLDTPYQNTEPKWWLEMMDLQEDCR